MRGFVHEKLKWQGHSYTEYKQETMQKIYHIWKCKDPTKPNSRLLPAEIWNIEITKKMKWRYFIFSMVFPEMK